MTPAPSNLPPDLADDWPDDPANAGLAAFARAAFDRRPELPPLALDRVQVRMRQEYDCLQRRRRWKTAAALFVAFVAIGGVTLKWAATRPAPNPPANPAPLPIQDQYEVTLPPASPQPPASPLLRPTDYAELFGQPPTTAPTLTPHRVPQ